MGMGAKMTNKITGLSVLILVVGLLQAYRR
jgi:hypothetical protein